MLKSYVIISLIFASSLSAMDKKTKSEGNQGTAQQTGAARAAAVQSAAAEPASQPKETLTLQSLGFLSLLDSSALPGFGSLYDEAFSDGKSFAGELHAYSIYVLQKDNKSIGFIALKEQNKINMLCKIAVTKNEQRKGY